MDVESARLFAAAIAVGFGATAPALGEGFIAARALEAMARNPSIKDDLFIKMIVAMAITESVGIYALVVTFIILFAV